MTSHLELAEALEYYAKLLRLSSARVDSFSARKAHRTTEIVSNGGDDSAV